MRAAGRDDLVTWAAEEPEPAPLLTDNNAIVIEPEPQCIDGMEYTAAAVLVLEAGLQRIQLDTALALKVLPVHNCGDKVLISRADFDNWLHSLLVEVRVQQQAVLAEDVEPVPEPPATSQPTPPRVSLAKAGFLTAAVLLVLFLCFCAVVWFVVGVCLN